MASSTARLARSSTRRSELSVSLVGFSEMRGDERPLRHGDRDGPVLAVGVARAAAPRRARVGAEGAGVAADADAAVDVGHLLHGDVLGQDRRRVGLGRRSRRPAQDHLPLAVEHREVDVGGDPARQVGLGDGQVALRRRT